MQIHRIDPRYVASDRARKNFRLAVKVAIGFVILLWVIHLLNWVLGSGWAQFGLRPREIDGLFGILAAPLLHGSFSHLISNSMPLFILVTGILYLYPASAFKAIALIYFGTGMAVWFLGRPSVHIGASGLVYGLAAYVFVAGLLRRDVRAVAASMLVYFLYGTLVWGILPLVTGVSWETHLAASIIGTLSAIWYRGQDLPPRKHYDWEEEHEDGSVD
jgi:membrane associated rhomboid family serine protease